MDAAAYYADHLREINEAIGIICRKHCLDRDAEDEFAQYVHLQLIEDDYRKIRSYKGSSSFKTYLYTVIGRIFIDQVRSKWHPSTEAERMGPVAVELEKLVFRHNYSVHEACNILSSNPQTTIDEQAARAVLDRLKVRRPTPSRADDSEDQLPRIPDPTPHPEKRLEQRQQSGRKREILSQMATALATLSDEDKLLIKLIFVSGHKIAEVARMLGRDERMLYRRTQTLLRDLRQAMLAAGIGEADAREALESPGAFVE